MSNEAFIAYMNLVVAASITVALFVLLTFAIGCLISLAKDYFFNKK